MIDVALIPAAGRGTRMRDASLAVPKPMLTVIDRPAIQWVMDEAVDAGVSEFVLIVSPRSLLESHFGDAYRGAGVRYAHQAEALGLGHAIATGRELVGDRPFLCLLSDNLAAPRANPSQDLVTAFAGHSVLGVRSIPEDLLASRGVAVVDEAGRVHAAIEKPGLASPSSLGLAGRYLFTPEIFELLVAASPGYGGEIQVTDSIDQLAKKSVVLSFEFDQDLLDTGTPAQMLEAIVTLARGSDEYGPDFEAFLRAGLT